MLLYEVFFSCSSGKLKETERMIRRSPRDDNWISMNNCICFDCNDNFFPFDVFVKFVFVVSLFVMVLVVMERTVVGD